MLKQLQQWWLNLFFRPVSPGLDFTGHATSPVQQSVQTLGEREALDSEALNEIFDQLRHAIYRHLDASRSNYGGLSRNPGIFREHGRLDSGRRYFFLKPIDSLGWLFERGGLGWTIARCDKIVGSNLFLRAGEPWDVISLYPPKIAAASVRVYSARTGGSDLSFRMYKKIMAEAVVDHLVANFVPKTHSSSASELNVGRDARSDAF